MGAYSISRPLLCNSVTDLTLEYALNAVNQGVTALGIKGKLSPGVKFELN